MLFLVFFLLGVYASAAGSQDFGFVCGFGLDREAGATGQSRQSGQLRPVNFSLALYGLRGGVLNG